MQKSASSLIKNKGATFHYEIVEEFVGGLVLTGPEAKSLRSGGAVLKSAWCQLMGNKILLNNFQINRYAKDQTLTHEPLRKKQVLLQKAELIRLVSKMQEQNLQLIPVEVFTMGRWIKVRLGLGRARKKIDKRNVIREREQKLSTSRRVSRI